MVQIDYPKAYKSCIKFVAVAYLRQCEFSSFYIISAIDRLPTSFHTKGAIESYLSRISKALPSTSPIAIVFRGKFRIPNFEAGMAG